MNSPKQNNHMAYERDHECCQKKLDKLAQTSNRVSFLRLITVAAAGVAYFLWYQQKTPAFLAFAFGFVFAFLMLIRYHGILEDEQTYLKDFQSVLKDYMVRFDDGWKGFPMNGARYLSDDMLESRDLDLFGKGSLYQYYLLPVGYGGNNLFLTDWSEQDFGNLDFYDVFEHVIERHLRTNHEELQRKAAYIPEENTSRAYTHKTVIRPLDDGGFQYVSNQIIFPEGGCELWWHSDRLTEDQWKEVYGGDD